MASVKAFFLISSSLLLLAAESFNSTASWLARRDDLIHEVFGYGPGVLSNKSVPDDVVKWPSDPEITGLVWNMTTRFHITSTVILSPSPGKKARRAMFYHQGHENCLCPVKAGDPAIASQQCRPGCASTMPTHDEIGMPGYEWWDADNVSEWAHGLGYDLFVFSLPLKGVNLGPGSNETFVETSHWWFLQWEVSGDHPLRYFIEPVVLTANYAEAAGYEEIVMDRCLALCATPQVGWLDRFGLAATPRTTSKAANLPTTNPLPPTLTTKPGAPRCLHATTRVGQYLLAGLEPGRYQVQILHEYDSCCFSPHGRHDQMLAYESNVRAELVAGGQRASGWFTTTANNHTKHEVAAQDKTIVESALRGDLPRRDKGWDALRCDMLHLGPSAGGCEANLEPGCVPAAPTALNPSGYVCT